MTHLNDEPSKYCPSPARAAFAAFALAFAFGAGSLPRTASAQEACGDETCPKGFTCETSAGACPAICIVPEDGEGCEPCNAPEIQYCVAAECGSDADCGEGMACAEHSYSECSGGVDVAPADPACVDADCREAQALPEPTCTTQTERMCTPRWQLPCTIASDCGAGFTCEETESCSTPGCDREDPEAECSTEVTCTPTGTSACVAVETACSSDADCESGWTCQTNGRGVCSSSPNGGEPECTTDGPAELCVPPYSNYSGGVAIAEDSNDAQGSPTRGEGESLNGPGAPSLADDDLDIASSAGGCSLGRAALPSSGGSASLLGALALWVLGRRRAQKS